MAVTILFYTGLSAIATSCSFAFATLVYVTDTLYKRKERRRSQAVLVDAWLSRVVKDGDYANVYANVSNRSEGTVRQVYFHLLDNYAVAMCKPHYTLRMTCSDAGPSRGLYRGYPAETMVGHLS